jgi:hypothetical protein
MASFSDSEKVISTSSSSEPPSEEGLEVGLLGGAEIVERLRLYESLQEARRCPEMDSSSVSIPSCIAAQNRILTA